jgi:ADP-L-glycero-D-manno-heptose 6-epimerase
MKILVTGHKGFIGSHMVRALKDQHEIVTYEYGDVWPIVHELDWIIHLGAISSTTERDVDKVMSQNYDFSVALYKEARHFGVNFQFASSASVYGLGTEFKENSPVDPRTPYAWSKYMFERYVQKRRPSGSFVQCFRYFNVYGPEGEEHKGNQASPFYQFGRQAAETGQIRVFENSDQYLRDFISVDQIIDTHIKFFEVKESGVWNLGTGNPISFLDVAKKFDAQMVTIPMPDILKDSYQKYTCADITKLTETIGKIST